MPDSSALTLDVPHRPLPRLSATRHVDVTIDVPAGWWQHLRHQYRDAWWARAASRRWPARMLAVSRRVEITGNVDRAILFPHAALTGCAPELGDPVPVVFPPDWNVRVIGHDRHLTGPGAHRRGGA